MPSFCNKFKSMRVLVLYVFVALSLASNGVEGNPCLSQSNSSIYAYKSFISNLREELTTGAHRSQGIPILKHSVPNSERFIFFNLSSQYNETITVAIDVEDVRVATYRAGNESYFFLNAPQLASQILFTNTHQNIMNFNNTFQSIEKAANTTRVKTPLGSSLLDLAISNLFHHRLELVPVSFLVVIQMVLEATKFRFIEQSVVNSMRDGKDFTPGLAMVSLENNWSELSLQLQASESLNGLFGDSILLYNSNDEPIEVDSIYYPIIIANMVFQLYQCPYDTIKMPRSEVDTHTTQNNKRCSLQSRTTRISGREGFCVDVARALDADGSRTILYPCGQQVNQKWTFYQDNTIRSLGKCLATNTSNFGSSIVIKDCDKASHGWDISSYGRIMSISSNLVLTANAATRSTNLTGERNTFAAKQAWRIGNYVDPIITTIIGLREMCLEATAKNTNMWLENCVKNKTEQYWALYSDDTIRVNNNHSLCVTCSTDSSPKVITIRGCDGSINQRWIFMPQGTILNPKYEAMMDVAQSNITLKKIILYPNNDSANQQWVIFY